MELYRPQDRTRCQTRYRGKAEARRPERDRNLGRWREERARGGKKGNGDGESFAATKLARYLLPHTVSPTRTRLRARWHVRVHPLAGGYSWRRFDAISRDSARLWASSGGRFLVDVRNGKTASACLDAPLYRLASVRLCAPVPRPAGARTRARSRHVFAYTRNGVCCLLDQSKPVCSDARTTRDTPVNTLAS